MHRYSLSAILIALLAVTYAEPASAQLATGRAGCLWSPSLLRQQHRRAEEILG